MGLLVSFSPKKRPTLKEMNFDKLGFLVDKYFKEHKNFSSVVELDTINSVWSSALGEKISTISTPKSFDVKTGKLTIKVENSLWRNDLAFMKTDLIDSLNKKLSDIVIQDIILR